MCIVCSDSSIILLSRKLICRFSFKVAFVFEIFHLQFHVQLTVAVHFVRARARACVCVWGGVG